MAQSPSRPAIALGPEIKRFRRLITGHDAQGRSIIISDGLSPHVMPIMDQPNFAVTDFWKVFSSPADNSPATAKDPCSVPIQVAPPAGGHVFRVVQFPPDKDWAEKAAAAGGSMPIDETAKAASKGGAARHAHMHRTRSIDYAIVLQGEIWAVMDVGESKMTAGDVLIQLVKKTRRWTKIFCPKKSVKEMIMDVRHAQERTSNSLSKHVRKGPMLLSGTTKNIRAVGARLR